MKNPSIDNKTIELYVRTVHLGYFKMIKTFITTEDIDTIRNSNRLFVRLKGYEHVEQLMISWLEWELK